MIGEQPGRHDERDGGVPGPELTARPRDRVVDPVRREHAIRNPEEIEEPGSDLAHEQMLGRVLASVAAPRHDAERRQSVHEREGGERVEARAEPRVLHDDRGPSAGQPGAPGHADGDVLAHRGDVGQARPALEGRNHPLDERAGDTREEVEARADQSLGEGGSGHYDVRLVCCCCCFSCSMNSAKSPTNSSRSAAVRASQCRPSDRLAVSPKSKMSSAILRTLLRRSSARFSFLSSGSSMAFMTRSIWSFSWSLAGPACAAVAGTTPRASTSAMGTKNESTRTSSA